MKNLLKRGLQEIIYVSRLHHLLPVQEDCLGLVLMFHRVCPERKKNWPQAVLDLQVSPSFLEKVILFYKKKGYTFISLDELAEVVKGNISIPKFICFTFDDGFADNFELAYPIFKKHEVPFTIYVTTGFINKSIFMWQHVLNDIIQMADKIELKDGKTIIAKVCKTPQEIRIAYQQVVNYINQLDSASQQGFVEELAKRFKMDPWQIAPQPLSWEQLRILQQDPIVTIGAHTVNHYELSKLSDQQVMEELSLCKQELETQLKTVVNHFAYPFGCWPVIGEREFLLAKNCGFKTCTTTRMGMVYAQHLNYMEQIPRFNVTEDCDLNLLDIPLLNAFNKLVRKNNLNSFH